jgi:two-component system OmpR family response regulator
MNILVVEDDSKIGSFIQKGLSESNLNSTVINNGLMARDALLAGPSYDLLILDLMLPGLDGLSLLKEIRLAGKNLPVIILSAKRSVEEKVEGLAQGADDYLEKPFAFSELLARVQVLLRRHQPARSQSTSLEKYGVHLDLLKREVTRDGVKIELQSKEFALLEYFMRNPERVLTKTMVLENVYGYNFDTQTNVVDVLVFRLRGKIDKDFSRKLIHTVRGVGHVFKED